MTKALHGNLLFRVVAVLMFVLFCFVFFIPWPIETSMADGTSAMG